MTKHKYQLIIWTLATFVIGFFMWWVWIGTVICLMVIFDFGKNSEKKLIDGLDFKCRQNAKVSDPDWKSYYIRECESPAEEQFLEALIAEYSLLPDYGVLRSPELVCEMQFKFNHYRFDFLMNGRLVVEIDGATYHLSPEAVERDKIRDAYSVDNKFTVLRIPASIVFKQPETAIARVKTALAKANLPVMQYEPFKEPEDTKSFFGHASESINAFSKFVSELTTDTSQDAAVKRRLTEYVELIADDVSQLKKLEYFADSLVRYVNLTNNKRAIPFSDQDLIDTKLMIETVTKDYAQSGHQLTISIPESKWVVLDIFHVDETDPLYKHLQSQIGIELQVRNKLVTKIRTRCDEDKYYKAHVYYYLISMSCPIDIQRKLAGTITDQQYSDIFYSIVSKNLSDVYVSTSANGRNDNKPKSANILSKQDHTKILNEILDPFLAALNAESDQIDFAVEFAEKMVRYPDIYGVDVVSVLVWQKILLPGHTAYENVNKLVKNQVDIEASKRADKMKPIFQRSSENKQFCQSLISVLVEMKCPIEIAHKMTGDDYKSYYFIRHQTYEQLY